MQKREFAWLLSIFLLVFGLLLILSPDATITGAAIGTAIIPSIGFIAGILSLISGILLLPGNSSDISKEQPDLEGKVARLLVEDNRYVVRFVDTSYVLSRELWHNVSAKSAEEVLGELRQEFSSDNELKHILQEELRKNGYFKAAYMQRDIVGKLEESAVATYADKFLSEWDPDYMGFVPPKNKYLRYKNEDTVKLTRKDVYDTRKALPAMEKNITGFKVLDKFIGNHDVNVEYNGARFRILAGSLNSYEVPLRNIMWALKRIAEEDVKAGNINDSEKRLRIEVLTKSIFD